MRYALEDILQRFPDLTPEEGQQVIDFLAREPAPRRAIWESEETVPESPLQLGPDGLTEPMRALMEFAEENALPPPFPPPRKGA